MAGGAEKCTWLRDQCRIDDVIDYRSQDVGSALRTLCPAGVDIFFDNVGGDMLQAAVDNMAKFGRIVRSEEHTSELQSLMRISYAVFCLKKKTKHNSHKCK